MGRPLTELNTMSNHHHASVLMAIIESSKCIDPPMAKSLQSTDGGPSLPPIQSALIASDSNATAAVDPPPIPIVPKPTAALSSAPKPTAPTSPVPRVAVPIPLNVPSTHSHVSRFPFHPKPSTSLTEIPSASPLNKSHDSIIKSRRRALSNSPKKPSRVRPHPAAAPEEIDVRRSLSCTPAMTADGSVAKDVQNSVGDTYKSDCTPDQHNVSKIINTNNDSQRASKGAFSSSLNNLLALTIKFVSRSGSSSDRQNCTDVVADNTNDNCADYESCHCPTTTVGLSTKSSHEAASNKAASEEARGAVGALRRLAGGQNSHSEEDWLNESANAAYDCNKSIPLPNQFAPALSFSAGPNSALHTISDQILPLTDGSFRRDSSLSTEASSETAPEPQVEKHGDSFGKHNGDADLLPVLLTDDRAEILSSLLCPKADMASSTISEDQFQDRRPSEEHRSSAMTLPTKDSSMALAKSTKPLKGILKPYQPGRQARLFDFSFRRRSPKSSAASGAKRVQKEEAIKCGTPEIRKHISFGETSLKTTIYYYSKGWIEEFSSSCGGAGAVVQQTSLSSGQNINRCNSSVLSTASDGWTTGLLSVPNMSDEEDAEKDDDYGEIVDRVEIVYVPLADLEVSDCTPVINDSSKNAKQADQKILSPVLRNRGSGVATGPAGASASQTSTLRRERPVMPASAINRSAMKSAPTTSGGLVRGRVGVSRYAANGHFTMARPGALQSAVMLNGNYRCRPCVSASMMTL